MPAPEKAGEACDRYEDSLTGGQVFTMYCSYCHNAPALAERPFANFRNVAAHMRVRANLTGKEYGKGGGFPAPGARRAAGPPAGAGIGSQADGLLAADRRVAPASAAGRS